MEATIVPDVQKHYPVLLKEIISVITPQHGGTFIDCTFGQGGYSKKILEFENTKVIGLDRDIESQKIANSILNDFEDRFVFKNLKFSQLTNLKIKNENIKGVIFDLGYSLTQMKDPKKGLSFNSMTDLNMQLGLNNYSAADAINKLNAKELEKIFKYFGDEKDAKYISKNITVVFPAHPRTTNKLKQFRLYDRMKKNANFVITEPKGYLDFLALTKYAKIVLTDSGGLQEETTALGVPCLTLRENTERPITVTEGTNTIVGNSTDAIISAANDILESGGKAGRIPELWDGNTASRIADELIGYIAATE